MITNSSIPKNRSIQKGFLNLNPSLWLTILIMSSAGLVATYLYHFKNSSRTQVTAPHTRSVDTDASIEKSSFTPDIHNISQQCSKMVSKENSFVIFEHGTCVRLLEPVTNHIQSATSSLKILSSPNISFVVKPLNNNDYLIVFNDYLFCWLFAKDIAHMKQSILSDSRLASSEKDPESIQGLTEFEQKLGKFARLLLLEDSKTVTVKKIIKANIPKNQAL